MSTEWGSAGTRTAPPWPDPPAAPEDRVGRLRWYAAVARWAPSKHNSQPWRFVVTTAGLELWADPERVLPATDPHRRELVISCGAALHLAVVAARAVGHWLDVTLLPQDERGLLARLVEAGPWSPTDEDHDLLAAVPSRRTDRGPLDGEALPARLRFELQDAATASGATLHLVDRPGDRATLAALVARADRLLVRQARVDQELAQWLREPGDERDDGVPTDHTRGAAASYRAEFVQRDFSSATSRPAPYRRLPDRPLLAVLCTPTDFERDWLVAGRALAAVLLLAERAGAHASYVNQPVEEPAMRILLREQLQLSGAPQLVLRLGVGSHVEPPPRRSLDDVVVRAQGD